MNAFYNLFRPKEKVIKFDFDLSQLSKVTGNYNNYKAEVNGYKISVNYSCSNNSIFHINPTVEPTFEYTLNRIRIDEPGKFSSGHSGIGPRNITIQLPPLPPLPLLNNNKIEIVLSPIKKPSKSFKMLKFIINGQEFVEKNIVEKNIGKKNIVEKNIDETHSGKTHSGKTYSDETHSDETYEGLDEYNKIEVVAKEVVAKEVEVKKGGKKNLKSKKRKSRKNRRKTNRVK